MDVAAEERAVSLAVVGAGWIGRRVADGPTTALLPRRSFRASDLPRNVPVVVASGRSALQANRDGIAAEVRHVGDVLAAASEAGSARVVVLGSSDVAGTAPVVRGSTPAAPRSAYAEAKAAVEEECRRWRDRGLDVTVVRLAPVHGGGKVRSDALVRLAARRIVPLPGGDHPVGFVFLDDAVHAIHHLSRTPAPEVVAVGAGPVGLGELLAALSAAHGRPTRQVPVPLPRALLLAAASSPRIPPLQWLARLSLPRTVELEVDVTLTRLDEVARRMVAEASS